MTRFTIDGHAVGDDEPTYFIADIAANHDGSLDRAVELIHLAKSAGADAAKFQHFIAERIVSDYGFRHLGGQLSHQAAWRKSVVEVYRDASVPWEWTSTLKAECDKAGITFFSAPYDLDAIDHLDAYVPAFKVGSGDIDWTESLNRIASKGKPVIVATGAASMADVARAVEVVKSHGVPLAVLQCNTNYTADADNIRHLHLRVVATLKAKWPDVVVGLSDHTHGNVAVLGAVALGARIIERHFTDDNDRDGPDHRFALNPSAWKSMVEDTRMLEAALGSGVKVLAENETDTAVIQRRCVRAIRDLQPGEVLMRDDLTVLRPATPGAFTPDQLDQVIGRRLETSLAQGQDLRPEHLAPRE